MKSNFILIVLCISGFFQILSISFDQYVIQKEHNIRNIDNEIIILNDQIDEIITSNISIGKFSQNLKRQVSEIIDKGEITKKEKKTLAFLNFETFNLVNRFSKNDYLPKYVTDNHEKYKSWFA